MNEKLIPTEVPEAVKRLVEDDNELKELLHDLFTELQSGMSRYQIHKFVLNPVEFPTPDSVWHQCLRELIGRFDSLAGLESELRQLRIKAELHTVKQKKYERAASNSTDELERQELKLKAQLEREKAEQAQRRIPFVLRQIKDTSYEAKAFLDAYRVAKRQRVFEHHEDAEPFNWYARVLMRRKYDPGMPLPPYIEEERQLLARLMQTSQDLKQVLRDALEASLRTDRNVKQLEETPHARLRLLQSERDGGKESEHTH